MRLLKGSSSTCYAIIVEAKDDEKDLDEEAKGVEVFNKHPWLT